MLQFSDPDRPWQGALVMTAAALAVTTPRYQWYALLLVMLVALDGRPEWLAFAAGAYYAAEPSLGRYTLPDRLHDAVAYGVPVLVVAVGLAGPARARPARGRRRCRCAPVGRTGRRRRGRSAVAADAERPMAAASGARAATGGAGRSGAGSERAAGTRRFLTGWLPASQTSNGTGPQGRE